MFIKMYLYVREKRVFFKKSNFKNQKNKEVNVNLIIFHDPLKIKLRSILGDLKRIVSEW